MRERKLRSGVNWQEARICRHNTDNVLMDKHLRTVLVILARY